MPATSSLPKRSCRWRNTCSHRACQSQMAHAASHLPPPPPTCPSGRSSEDNVASLINRCMSQPLPQMKVKEDLDQDPPRTVDFKALNDVSVRQTHHTKSPFALASEVPRGTVKSVLDVWNAYHSVPIRAEDKDKTTFITLWERFLYLSVIATHQQLT